MHQDILDTLKRVLLKNTNIRGLYWKLLIIANVIRHIGRVVEQIGRTPGQAAAVSFILLVLKKILQIPQSLKVFGDFGVHKKQYDICDTLKGSRGSRIAYCQI